MLSYTQRRNLFGKLTNDSSSENLTYGDTLMNEAEKRVMNKGSWPFIQRTKSITTVADQQFYDLPFNYRKLIGNPKITVGTTGYVPTEVPDRATWDYLNSTTNSSDAPSHFFIFNKQIGLYPTPSTSGNTILIPYEIQQRDLSIADYTTGSVVSIANAGTTLTATGTAFQDSFIGRSIRITEDDTVDSGDGEWYEIESVTSTTVLELSRPYDGTSISGATQDYAIGQTSVLPDGYDMLPVYKATEQYYIENDNMGKADRFGLLYDDLFDDLVSDRGSKTSDLVVNSFDRDIENPNYFPSSVG